MTRIQSNRIVVVLLSTVGLSGPGCAGELTGEGTGRDLPLGTAGAPEPEEIPFKTVKLLIEHNAADEDTGFQFFADGEPWHELTVRGPDGSPVLHVIPAGDLADLGLTEMFFETSEPPNAEVPIPEVLAHLPAGRYEFEGVAVDGVELEGELILSHRIPAAPVVTAAPSPTVPVRHDVDHVMRWNAVTTALHGGTSATVTHYQVIVTKADQVPGRGFGSETFSVHVPASVRSMKIPAEFLLPSTAYGWEVMAIERNGNQTFSAGSFRTQR